MPLVARSFAIFGLAWLLSIGGASAQGNGNEQRQDHYVTLQTTKGPILIRVFYSVLPRTAGNFLNLVDRNFYDGLTFHRVENWVVQGGDPQGNGTGSFIDPSTGAPRYIRLEIDRRLTHNYPGMVAMARSQDPNSASCQFYILKRPMPQLNGQYAVFGQVLQGMRTVQSLQIGDRIVSARITDPVDQSQGAGDTPAQQSEQPVAPSGAAPARGGGDSGF